MRQIAALQTSKNMREPLFSMLFPVLGAYVSGAEFQYPDLTWKELCGILANQVADFDGNKGKLTYLVEAICRNFRQQDAEELKKFLQRLLSADETHSVRRPKTCRPQLKKEWIGE